MTTGEPSLTVNGLGISAAEAVALLRQHLGADPKGKTAWYSPIVDELMIRKAARREGIPPVTDEELQAGVDAVRSALGLYSVAETEAWLASNCMALADLERGVETNLLSDRWAEKAVGNQVQSYFTENRPDFDQVALSQIVVIDEIVAHELKEQSDLGDADFATLARAYSMDQSAERGGYLGYVHRAALPHEIERVVFDAKEGSAAGPVGTAQGYHILYVHEFKAAGLDDRSRRQIRTILMEPILEAERSSLQVRLEA